MLFNLVKPITRTISTSTLLLNWTRLHDFDDLVASLANLDGAEDVYLIVETSEDGTHPDVDVHTVRIPAGKQGAFEVQDNRRTYYRFTAQTTSPGFPVVSGVWALNGYRTTQQR